MGSIRKRNGKYQAQVRRDGVPSVSKTFIHKKDAIVWVRGLEARIDASEINITVPKLITLRDILIRYAEELHHRRKVESKQTVNRVRSIADFKFSQLNSAAIAKFRDRRSKDGLRAAQIDMGIIRHAVKIANQEWDLRMAKNPVDGVRIPNGVRQRDRRLNEGEYEKLKKAAQNCRNIYTWASIDFAIETAMRRSEILNMRWKDVCFEKKIVTLKETKNGSLREIPLSRHAQSTF